MRSAIISDIACKRCIQHVSEALESLGLRQIKIDLETKRATFEGDAREEAIRIAVSEAGYTVASLSDGKENE